MCGIVGIAGEHDADLIEHMNAAIYARGPDDSGVFRADDLSLAMRRLSIIDVRGGHQPMLSDDGRYVLVYNGEIFNAAALRRELEQQGIRFRTDHSDTEVLLHLLIRGGENAVPRLNGMFVFALLDRSAQTLLCGRDRFGIKPLYYTTAGGRFSFASEAKALLLLPWVRREPNLQSLFHYFSLNFVPGAPSAFAGIERLVAGSCLTLDLRTRVHKIVRWWTPDFEPRASGTREEIANHLSPVLASAVDRWAISDVPIGCLLSGGLDSSAIVSMLAMKGHSLKTFTVGFRGPGEESWNELALAAGIAHKWGTEHEEIVLDPDSLLDDLADMVWALDEPYGGGLPSWAVFKAIGDAGMKVAMTGTGGDELFGNYNKYQFLEGRIRSHLRWGRRKSADRGQFQERFFARYYSAGDAEKRGHMLTGAFSAAEDTAELLWRQFSAGPAHRSLRDRVANTDLSTQLADEFLLMTDRFSMAHSVEARTPFLDNELAAEVFAVDASQRLGVRPYKPLLRHIVANLLPPELLQAPKRGFVIPLKLWLRGRLQPLMRRLLSPRRLEAQGLVRQDFFERYAVPHIAGATDSTDRLWNMLMFQLWWEIHVAGRPLNDLRAEIQAPE